MKAIKNVFVIGYKCNKQFSNCRYWWEKLFGKVLYKEQDVQELIERNYQPAKWQAE